MKKNIVVVNPISTGVNLVYDVMARGYQPVVMFVPTPGSMELRESIDEVNRLCAERLPAGTTLLDVSTDYDAVLEMVRSYDPVLVIAASEFGIPMATHLASDLGLRGNKWENIGKMTRKDEMQQALADYGIRYIRGRLVASEGEAKAFYEELGTTHIVIKPVRGAGTVGVYFCEGLDETLQAVRKVLAQEEKDGNQGSLLMQERIIGKEFIVNTVSCDGRHRLVSMWQYDKVPMNGSNLYNYIDSVNRLSVGHSQLISYAYEVLNAIGIEWGAVHGEYIVDEHGPVLVEVNCRPMGGGLPRLFVEQIFGQHETDSHLDAYLDPVKFEQERLKPYRPKRKGRVKLFIQPQDVNLKSAPVLQLVKQLKSFFGASLERVSGDPFISRTYDLETSAGTVYLGHDDEKQVVDDCDFLHLLEMKYPQMLFNELKAEDALQVKRHSLNSLLKEIDPHGSTLVFTDSSETSERATVVDGHLLTSAYVGYEQGILDLSRKESYCDVESLLQQLFLFLGKLREGGRVFVPESTYCHLPYGINGMEILLYAAGFRIEAPLANRQKMMVASN